MKKFAWWIIGVVAVVVIALILVFTLLSPSPQNPGTPSTTAGGVTYSCTGGKTIVADFGSSTVSLALSDGRTFDLPQTQSASGVRYETGAGTSRDVVFVNEGANAFLTENGTTTFADCVENTTPAGAGANASTSSFTDQGKTFAFDYPSQFSVTGGGVGYTTQWMQNTTSSGLILAQLSIPSSFEPHTNFAGATFTVGTSPDPSAVAECLTQTNGNVATTTQVTLNGTAFTKISYGDAGAGNFYAITSYRTVRNGQCYAVEYVIHSTNIQNYPRGSGITAFDKAAVQGVLEGIVQSFRFL